MRHGPREGDATEEPQAANERHQILNGTGPLPKELERQRHNRSGSHRSANTVNHSPPRIVGPEFTMDRCSTHHDEA